MKNIWNTINKNYFIDDKKTREVLGKDVLHYGKIVEYISRRNRIV